PAALRNLPSLPGASTAGGISRGAGTIPSIGVSPNTRLRLHSVVRFSPAVRSRDTPGFHNRLDDGKGPLLCPRPELPWRPGAWGCPSHSSLILPRLRRARRGLWLKKQIQFRCPLRDRDCSPPPPPIRTSGSCRIPRLP